MSDSYAVSAPEKPAGLASALAKAQAEFPKIERVRTVKVRSKRTGAEYQFSYAPLDFILNSVRPVLSKHGLSLIQALAQAENGSPAVQTILFHESGDSVEASFPLENIPEAPQELGSLLSYIRRYAVQAILGIATEDDDDANTAEGNEFAFGGAKSVPPARPQGRRGDAASGDNRGGSKSQGAGSSPPEKWLDQTIGFGKHRDQTWRWLAQGSPGGEREGYLMFLVDRIDKEPIREKARVCLKLIAQSANKAEGERAVAPSDAQVPEEF